MCLTGALGLSCLVEALPLGACFDIVSVDLFAKCFNYGKHQPVAQIAVVSNCQHFAAGLLFCGGHPLPEILWVITSERFHRGERLDETGLVAILEKNNISMEVVSACVRRPLESDKSGEPPGIVKFLRSLNVFTPGRPIPNRPRIVNEVLRKGSV